MNRTEPHITTLMQRGLIAAGQPLPRFGADGQWGSETQAAYNAYVNSVAPLAPRPAAGDWPSDDIDELYDFYGRPDLSTGRAPRSVPMELPYPMQITWGGRGWVTRQFVHERVHDSLQRVLTRLMTVFGPEGIREHGLDQLGGITNVRYMRGSRSKVSRHSFGIAIDIDPVRNGLRTTWPSPATMPERAIECFEEDGWISYGRLRGRDAMHFQATSNHVGN